MTQADTVYDIIDSMDDAVLREFLLAGRTKCDARPGSLDELNFACRMSLGRLFRRNNAFDRQKVRGDGSQCGFKRIKWIQVRVLLML